MMNGSGVASVFSSASVLGRDESCLAAAPLYVFGSATRTHEDAADRIVHSTENDIAAARAEGCEGLGMVRSGSLERPVHAEKRKKKKNMEKTGFGAKPIVEIHCQPHAEHNIRDHLWSQTAIH
jgi:hypothetical protein